MNWPIELIEFLADYRRFLANFFQFHLWIIEISYFFLLDLIKLIELADWIDWISTTCEMERIDLFLRLQWEFDISLMKQNCNFFFFFEFVIVSQWIGVKLTDSEGRLAGNVRRRYRFRSIPCLNIFYFVPFPSRFHHLLRLYLSIRFLLSPSVCSSLTVSSRLSALLAGAPQSSHFATQEKKFDFNSNFQVISNRFNSPIVFNSIKSTTPLPVPIF